MSRALSAVWAGVTGVLLSVVACAYAELGPHLAGARLSVGAAVAVVGLPALVAVLRRWTGSALLGLVPWTTFVLAGSVQGTRRPEGDLLLVGDAAGVAVLYGGALAGALAIGLLAALPRRP